MAKMQLTGTTRQKYKDHKVVIQKTLNQERNPKNEK